MKKIISTLIFALMVELIYSQVINGDLVMNSKFSGSPYIGVSGGGMSEMNDGLYLGGNIGVRFYTGNLNGGSAFQIPIMGEARYFVNGSNDGFYPFANLGLLYHHYKFSNQYITIDASGTYFTFAIGAGMKAGSIDFSIRYENIQFKLGHGDNICFRVGFWLGDNGSGHKRRR